MSKYPSLSSSFYAGRIRLKNRIVMAPMSRLRTDKDAAPKHVVAQYLAQRASAGLVISEAMGSVPGGDGQARIPGIFTHHQRVAWEWVVSAVHGAGGKIVAQLSHVGKARKGTGPEKSNWRGPENPLKPADLSIEELQRIPSDFAVAATRAMEAGFDGVEIHNANGYFFDRLLRPHTNTRRDAYGGSIENRTRLTLEIADAVVAAIGRGRMGLRLSPNIVIDDEPDDSNIETFSHLIGALSDSNLAYLHISRITRANANSFAETGVRQITLEDIRRIHAGALIAAGEFDPVEASDLVSRGIVDAVAFGRPFIANPDLVHRIQAGAPLSEPDRSTFYTPDAAGLIDYPTMADPMPPFDASRDFELQARRRTNLRHLIDLMSRDGITSESAHGKILGNLTVTALRELLAGAEISDDLARDVEWGMSRPMGWLDNECKDGLDD